MLGQLDARQHNTTYTPTTPLQSHTPHHHHHKHPVIITNTPHHIPPLTHTSTASSNGK